MPSSTPALPDDIEQLKALVLAQQSLLTERAVEIEQLKLLIAKLRRLQFGRSSEKLDRQIEQLELRLEELQTVQAHPRVTPAANTTPAPPPVRRALPPHLPREEVVHQPACTCPECGGTMKRIGEDVCEILEYDRHASR